MGSGQRSALATTLVTLWTCSPALAAADHPTAAIDPADIPAMANGMVETTFSAPILTLLVLLALGLVYGLWQIFVQTSSSTTREEDPRERTLAAARRGRAGEAVADVQDAPFRSIFGALPDALVYTDADQAIIAANEAACTLLGDSARDLSGRPFRTLIDHSYDPPREHPGDAVQERRFKRRDGSTFIGESLQTVIRDSAGEFIGQVHHIRDVTQDRESERRLRESSNRLIEAQRIAHIGNWEWDIAANELWWSEEIFRIFGVRPEQTRATYDEFLAHVHPDDRNTVRRHVSDALFARRPLELEHRILRPDRTVRFVRQQGEIVFDSRGKAMRIIGTIQDITDSRLAEQANLRRQQYLAAADQISAVITRASSLEGLLGAAAEELRQLFAADRVWFIYPCDPSADAWSVRKEQRAAELTEAADQTEIFTTVAMSQFMQHCLAGTRPVRVPSGRLSLDEHVLEHYDISSSLGVQLRPQSGAPWLLLLHACDQPRDWTDDEAELLQSLAGRIADAITNHLLTQQLEDDIRRRRTIETALRENERRYRSIFQNASVSLWEEDYTGLKRRLDELKHQGVADFETYLEDHPEFLREACQLIRVLDVNDATLAMFGARSKPELLDDLSRLMREESLDAIRRKIIALASGQHHFITESSYNTLDGKRLRVMMQLTFPRNQAEFSNIPVSLIDITEQKETEEKLRLSATVFENTVEGVTIMDDELCVVAVNKAFSEITGYDEKEVRGQPAHLIRAIMDDSEARDAMWAAIREVGQWQGEVWDSRKNGEVYPAWLTISPVRNEFSEISHYVAVFDDITVLKRSQEQLDHLAHHDPLTNLPNRMLFNDRLQHAMQHAHRQKSQLALLFLDLDRFKNVNDTQGHPAGDRLLQEVARRLVACVREDDTVARLGGDEFTIILENVYDNGSVSIVAQKILDALAKPFKLEEEEIYLTTSIGISLYPQHGRDATSLVKNADVAMYRAKETGRNTYQFYTRELTANAYERFSLESSLRRALERDEFLLHYQPQIDIETGKLVGAEALVRWEHPKLGLIPPNKFIPLAEDTGLIIPLGEWILHQACHQHRAWSDRGFEPIALAVNLSAGQMHKGLVPLVERILRESGMKQRHLGIEITESLIMTNVDENVSILGDLCSLGLRVALDDFGTGYSSLSYLKRFPIHTVKIDKSFVRDLVHDADDAAIIRAIIAMAKSLKLDVTAEGVEEAAQLDILRDLKCDKYQGYFFSPPVASTEFERFLQRKELSPVTG